MSKLLLFVSKQVQGLRQICNAIWRLIAQTSTLRVAAVCAMFAVVIIGGASVVRDPLVLTELLTGFGSGRGSGSGGGSSSSSGSGGILNGVRMAPLEGASGLAPDDPVLRFNETRIGHVLFTGSATNVCRRMLFDNKNGAMQEATDIFCGSSPEQVIDAPGGDRLNWMQKSFRR